MRAYFREAATICQRDGGRFWSVSLCGPRCSQTCGRERSRQINLVRLATGLEFLASRMPLEWGGSRWAAYMWDFTTALPTPRARREFMLHELFRRIQPDLGRLMTLSGLNAHLDTVEGRIWLRLEWRALSRALDQSGEDRRRAVSNAVAFRSARRSSFHQRPGTSNGRFTG